MKSKIDVCLSPDLISAFDLEGKIVVVADVLRASSCMVSALSNGAAGVIPVATLDECKELQQQGCICAAERNGRQVEGFALDNSPFSYMNPELQGKTIATTTTNGTSAITKSLYAHQVLIGAFLNLSAIAGYLRSQSRDLIIHCAGWKGKVNMEDSLFAGALIEKLLSTHEMCCDAPHICWRYYQCAKDRLLETVLQSAHAKRLAQSGVSRDIELCVEIDKYNVVPVLQGRTLVPLSKNEQRVD